MEGKARVDISGLKASFIGKFPAHSLSKVLLSEPDKVTIEELLAKAQTWLAFFQGDRRDE